MIPLTEDRKMLGYELLASYPGISCFVTTRHGGCSQGNYASLNCTPYTGDEAEAVRRNQEIVCSSLPQTPPRTGHTRFRPTGQRHLSLTELICMQQQKNATPCCRALMH
mgnify:FL=1